MEKLLPAEPFVAEKHGKLEQKMEAHLQIFERKKESILCEAFVNLSRDKFEQLLCFCFKCQLFKY